MKAKKIKPKIAKIECTPEEMTKIGDFMGDMAVIYQRAGLIEEALGLRKAQFLCYVASFDKMMTVAVSGGKDA